METNPLKEMLFLELADLIHEDYQRIRTWGWLSSVCTKLEPVSSKSKEIIKINVLQGFSQHGFYMKNTLIVQLNC